MSTARPSEAGPALPDKVAVIGAGLMGTGIAVVLATGVQEVALTSRRQESLDRSQQRAERYVAALHRHGQLTTDVPTVLGRLRFTTSLESAVSGAGFVVESITEDAAAKRALYSQLDTLVPPPVVLSSNTSALPVAEFAQGVRHPERVLISHFIQPAHVVPVLEVVRGADTSQSAVDRTVTLWRALGRVPLLMQRDEPGFLINRLQHALVREAVRLLAEGLATAEDIDAAVQYGLAPRFITAGPLKQRDVNGLAMHVRVASRLWPELDTPDGAGVALTHLQQLVDSGAQGLESGRGFYDWGGRDADGVRQTLDDQLLELTRAALALRGTV
ncbi:MAG: 3-hydroxyacyl-CoA dehydrogenase NAD-binding domain-containing protein [Chloroflexota bacterium]|nr:3-hydroxyacyl-CoA dehydrogenase NAD-binding domain-containing protein [Chloroflexota bacterium]